MGHIIWISLVTVTFLLYFWSYNKLLILFGHTYVYLKLSLCIWGTLIFRLPYRYWSLLLFFWRCQHDHYIFSPYVYILDILLHIGIFIYQASWLFSASRYPFACWNLYISGVLAILGLWTSYWPSILQKSYLSWLTYIYWSIIHLGPQSQ